MSKNLPKKHKTALNTFINDYKNHKNVIGIILTGSFVHSKPDKNSDLDIYIILENSKFRERGNTWINGVEIEYFINPVKQIEKYFEDEKYSGKHSAHMIANGIILYKNSPKVDELIKKAKANLKLKLQKLDKTSIELAKYHIDDLQKDLEDSYLKNDEFTFFYISNEILALSLDLFSKINRFQIEKNKRLKNQLVNIDKNFQKLYEKALVENNFDKKYKKLKELIKYVENLLGGKREKEWKMKSKCNYD